MQSLVLHFPLLHVQTWNWSKSSHKFAKLFFLFRPVSFISCISVFQEFHPAVFLNILSTTTHLLCLSPTACPPGTYKPEGAPGGPSTCLPCPDLQHTSQPGSTAPSDCVCKPGYQPVGMTCQSEWNWCDIWFTPPGPNSPKHRRLLLTVGENGAFGPRLMKAFTFVPIIWSLDVTPSQYLLCKDCAWPYFLLSGGSWPVGNKLYLSRIGRRKKVFHCVTVADLCSGMCVRTLRGGSRWSWHHARSAAWQLALISHEWQGETNCILECICQSVAEQRLVLLWL